MFIQDITICILLTLSKKCNQVHQLVLPHPSCSWSHKKTFVFFPQHVESFQGYLWPHRLHRGKWSKSFPPLPPLSPLHLPPPLPASYEKILGSCNFCIPKPFLEVFITFLMNSNAKPWIKHKIKNENYDIDPQFCLKQIKNKLTKENKILDQCDKGQRFYLDLDFFHYTICPVKSNTQTVLM